MKFEWENSSQPAFGASCTPPGNAIAKYASQSKDQGLQPLRALKIFGLYLTITFGRLLRLYSPGLKTAIRSIRRLIIPTFAAYASFKIGPCTRTNSIQNSPPKNFVAAFPIWNYSRQMSVSYYISGMILGMRTLSRSMERKRWNTMRTTMDDEEDGERGPVRVAERTVKNACMLIYCALNCRDRQL